MNATDIEKAISLNIAERKIGDVISHTVDARNLHGTLKSKREFATWIKDRIEKYGFQQDTDFMTILSKSNGRP